MRARKCGVLHISAAVGAECVRRWKEWCHERGIKPRVMRRIWQEIDDDEIERLAG